MVQVALRRRRRRLRSQKTYGWVLALIGVIIIIEVLLLSQNEDSQEIRPLLSSPVASPERLVENSQNLQSKVNVRAPGEENRINKAAVPDWLGEDWQDEECIPFAKWQLIENSPSSCNMLHEMPIAEPGALNFINCGAFRCAFSITNYLDEKVILKWTG